MGMLLRLGLRTPAVADDRPGPTAPVAAAPNEPPAPPPRPARPSTWHDGRELTIAAVADNLHLILNTKEGYGWFLPGFGLGNYFVSPAAEALPALIAEIEANVRRFETRLVEPVLTVIGRSESWIVFRLTGRLAGRAVALGIRFNVSFGTVRIEVQDDGSR